MLVDLNAKVTDLADAFNEAFLINSYLLAAGESHANAFTDFDADEVEEDEALPLVPLGTVNSTSNRTIQVPIWPVLTKANSRFLHADPDRPISGRSKVR